MEAQTTLAIFHAHLYQDLVNMLADLTEGQLEYSAPQIDSRCIRDVAIHAYRPLLAVACVLTGEEWPARPQIPATKDELFQLLHTMRLSIDERIASLTPAMLERTINLPWHQQQNGLESIIESLAHGSLHTGALQGIRAIGGFPTPAEDPKPPRGKG